MSDRDDAARYAVAMHVHLSDLAGEPESKADFTVMFRMNRKVWEDWGRYVGTGSPRRGDPRGGRCGGRGPRLAEAIEREVKRLRESEDS